jgi:hypothetical protein
MGFGYAKLHVSLRAFLKTIECDMTLFAPHHLSEDRHSRIFSVTASNALRQSCEDFVISGFEA